MRFSMIFAAVLAFGSFAAAPASAETKLAKNTVSIAAPTAPASTTTANQWRGRYGYRGYGYGNRGYGYGNRGWRGYRSYNYRRWYPRYNYRPRYYGGYRGWRGGWNRGWHRGWDRGRHRGWRY